MAEMLRTCDTIDHVDLPSLALQNQIITEKRYSSDAWEVCVEPVGGHNLSEL